MNKSLTRHIVTGFFASMAVILSFVTAMACNSITTYAPTKEMYMFTAEK